MPTAGREGEQRIPKDSTTNAVHNEFNEHASASVPVRLRCWHVLVPLSYHLDCPSAALNRPPSVTEITDSEPSPIASMTGSKSVPFCNWNFGS